MHKVSITSHIGRAQHDLKSGKDTRISSSGDLSKAERHNNHDYTKEDVGRMESAIDLDSKQYNKQFDKDLNEVDYLHLVDAVKELYHEEFDVAVANYNSSQVSKGHSERCIDDYFESISNNKKQEVAVEGIIQFGDMEDWKDMSIEEKKKAEPILFKGLSEVLKIPGFKLAGVSLHLNESSPHIHYVGICVDSSKQKTGLEKRIGKAKVFTPKIMSNVLQDGVRAAMEPLVKEVYGWEFKEKESGRNQDYSKNQIRNKKLQEENELIINTIQQYKDTPELDKEIEIAKLKKENKELGNDISRLQEINRKLKEFIQITLDFLRKKGFKDLADTIESGFKKLMKGINEYGKNQKRNNRSER